MSFTYANDASDELYAAIKETKALRLVEKNLEYLEILDTKKYLNKLESTLMRLQNKLHKEWHLFVQGEH